MDIVKPGHRVEFVPIVMLQDFEEIKEEVDNLNTNWTNKLTQAI